MNLHQISPVDVNLHDIWKWLSNHLRLVSSCLHVIENGTNWFRFRFGHQFWPWPGPWPFLSHVFNQPYVRKRSANCHETKKMKVRHQMHAGYKQYLSGWVTWDVGVPLTQLVWKEFLWICSPRGLCNIGYLSKTHLKLKSCKIAFIHNISFRWPFILKMCILKLCHSLLCSVQNLKIIVQQRNKWTHWGLVTPYGDRDLGQHWLR